MSGGSLPGSPPGPLPGSGGRRRPFARRLIGAGLLAWPLLELVLLVAVGRMVGVFGVLLLLLAGVVAGVALLRWVGITAARQLAAGGGPGVVGPGTAPAASPRTALLVPAAFLLMVPGFGTDVVGLVLLVPAVRRAVAARLGEAVVRRVSASGVRFGAVPFGGVPGMGMPEPVEVRVYDAPPAAGSPPPSSPEDPLAIEPPRP